MQLPPFVLIEDPINMKDKTLILQTSPPYLIGQVWRFTSDEERSRWIGTIPMNPMLTEVIGFNVVVLITSQLIPGNNEIDSNLADSVGLGMANYYYDARMEPSLPRFKRYLKQR